MTTESPGNDAGAMTRRMRRTAMLTAIVAIAPLSLIGAFLTSKSWWEGLSVATGLLLSLIVLKDWSLDRYPPRAAFALVFAGGAWALCAVMNSGPLSFVPFSLLGALLVARFPENRLVSAVYFSLVVGLFGATVFITHRATITLVDGYVLLPIAGTLFFAGVVALSERSWLLVSRLDRAKEAEAELAVAQERMRFAGDLHDIQGHTLHVIKLKAALAQQLVSADSERAEAELGDIRILVDDTIRRTRELAYAQHEIDFATELENARQVCEAAGITVDVRTDAAAIAGAHPLLAHVLREATTNLLRHAEPTLVSIVASQGHVEITNDGVPDSPQSEFRGLARLSERIALAGGELHTERAKDRFVVSAVLAPQAADGSARAQHQPGRGRP